MKIDPEADNTPTSQNKSSTDGDSEAPETVHEKKTARRAASFNTSRQSNGVPSPKSESTTAAFPSPQLKLERTSLRTWRFTGPEGAVTRALAIKKLTQLAAGAGAVGVGGSLLHETVIWIGGVITIGAMTFIFILGIKAP